MVGRIVEVERAFYGVSTYLDLCQSRRQVAQNHVAKKFKKYSRMPRT
jgi:hypothetical protein